MSPKEVCASFFSAIERGDMATVTNIYHDDLKVWHNFTNAYQNKTENIGVLAKLKKFENVKYDVQEVIVTGDRLAQRHWLILTKPGGEVLKAAGVLFMTIRDDKIVEMAEYLDSVPVMEIFAFMDS